MSNKLPINIDDVLRQRTVESDRVEYKEGWNPDKTIQTLCAFANDFQNLGGGYLVIGQNSDGDNRPVFPPVGLHDKQLDKIQRELLANCQLIQPPYFPVLTIEKVDGHNVIVLWAPGGQNRPYKAPDSIAGNRKVWHYYIRRYSSTVVAKGADEQELISLANKVPFDDRFNQRFRVDDLRRPLMQTFLEDVESSLAEGGPSLSVEALGRQMNVAGGPDESPWPKNVGLMFFNEAPDLVFPGTQIDVLWFPEGAGGDRFDEKSFKGPLGRMAREALDYIQRNYLHETVVKNPGRAEATRIWNYPFEAIEEALVNAVYHRSYEEREPIEVRIDPDELVIVSYPGPDQSIKMEDLRSGRAVSRRYRNRRIGEFLKELDLTEGRATGIPKILKVMAANGSQPPLFETDPDRTSFVIRLPRHPLARGPEDATHHDPHHDPHHDAPHDVLHVTSQVFALLTKVSREMTRPELMEALKMSDRANFSATYLRPAIRAGLLEMTLPDKPQSKNQRYRLTAAGRQWLLANNPPPD